MSIEKETKKFMQDGIEHYKKELSRLRSGRANPAVLDAVMVDVYGTQMRLKELGSVTCPEPRQILITPFDPQTAGPIAKGIDKANLNLNPILDGYSVRINVPPMDEAMRKEIAKQVKKKAEDAKVSIREVRRKANELVRKQKAEGIIGEDEVKKEEKKIQELTDQFCKEIDEVASAKEKEVMTV